MTKKDCINWIITNKEKQKNGWNRKTPKQFYGVIKMFATYYKCSYKTAYYKYINFIFNTNFEL